MHALLWTLIAWLSLSPLATAGCCLVLAGADEGDELY